MIKKRASEIFAKADPQLKVVDAHPGRRSRTQWEDAGGVFCTRCNSEVLWRRPSDGVCKWCVGVLDVKEDREYKKRVKLLRQIKAHNARVAGRSKTKAPG